jgi:hypothetical protein
MLRVIEGIIQRAGCCVLPEIMMRRHAYSVGLTASTSGWAGTSREAGQPTKHFSQAPHGEERLRVSFHTL